MSNGARRVGLACVLGGAMAGGVALAAPPAVAQTDCHPAYGGCIPNVPYDLDCADVGYAVVPVWDVYYDPYGLDTLYGPGNGWTCDSYS
jgi:hypothetical protein